MRIFTQDRRKLWVLLPALGLMLFASAAWAGDNPGPALPKTPWMGWVPGSPNTPAAPNTPSPEIPEGVKNILRYTDIPGAQKLRRPRRRSLSPAFPI